jgi:hypothetical protein
VVQRLVYALAKSLAWATGAACALVVGGRTVNGLPLHVVATSAMVAALVVASVYGADRR